MRERDPGVMIDITGLPAHRLDTIYIAASSGNASLKAFRRTLGQQQLEAQTPIAAISHGAVETGRLVKLMQPKTEKGAGGAGHRKELAPDWPVGARR